MTVNIIPNTFWKKDVITEGINVTPAFPDLANSTDTSFKLAGGSQESNCFVLSGSVPPNPTYGSGELRRGMLRLYCSDVETQYNREPLSLVGYAIDKNIQLAEGGYSFALSGGSGDVVGNKISIYNSIPYSDIPLISEEFEGAVEELGTINRMGNNSNITLGDPYVTEDTIKEILKSEGRASNSRRMRYIRQALNPYTYKMRHGGPQINPKTGKGMGPDPTREQLEANAGKTSSGWPEDESTSFDVTVRRYPIEFVDNNIKRFKFVNPPGTFSKIGLSILDVEARRFCTAVHRILYKQIKWDTRVTATADLEGNPAASKGNTILRDFYATRDFSNPYDASDSNPIINSVIELTTEKALNGGQSLRLYHNWGYSVNNPTIQNQLEVKGNLNPQCARVSLYDIPYPPMPFDVGMSEVSAIDSKNNHGDARAVMPEIQVAMNITKMEPNVYLNVASGSSGTFNNSNAVKLYADGNAAYANTAFSKVEASFLRCVAVTFSNYKPKSQHTTLDKFLDYGLTRFYNGKDSDNIVGGVVFTRWDIDGGSSLDDGGQGQGNNMFAYPIPVQAIRQSPDTSSKTLNVGGLGKINGGSAGGDFDLTNCDSLIWGIPGDTDAESDAQLRHCQLPMNSWFTMRCFADVFQWNTFVSSTKRPYAISGGVGIGGYGNDATGQGYRGVPMRIIFDVEGDNEQIVIDGASSPPTHNPILVAGTVVEPNTRNLPFLDIFFPATNESAGLTANRQWNWYNSPEKWPKHMTIWTQNYPWVSGSTGSDPYEPTPWKFGDSALYPSGASRESEVFIDSIRLLNFTPTVQSANTNGVMNFTPSSHLSPVSVGFDDDLAYPTYRHSWLNSSAIEITGNVSFTAGAATGTIVDNGLIDGSMLDTSGPVTLTSDACGAAGTNEIDYFTGLYSFVMTGNADSTATESVVFTADGTLDPFSNRANLYEYNTGQNMVVGFDSIEDLPQIATGSAESGCTGFVLANDFTTIDWTGVTADPLLPRKAKQTGAPGTGALFSRNSGSTNYWPYDAAEGYKMCAGGDMFICGPGLYDWDATTPDIPFNNVSGCAFDVNDDGSSLGGDEINLGTGSNSFLSVDGFRQKGFMYFNVSGSGTTDAFPEPRYAWGKRENILCSTKIMKIASMSSTDTLSEGRLSNNQIEVADPSIFNFENENERYIIYLMGGSTTRATSSFLGVGFDSYKKGNLQLAQEPEGNVITFHGNLRNSSAGSDFAPLMTEENLDRLWVSPEKYWLTMMYDSAPDTANRTYTSFCTINETPNSGSLSAASGTTYNESVYSYNLGAIADSGAAGFYKNLWDLIPGEDNSTLITSIDYGFGAFDAESSAGGYITYGSVEPSAYNYYNFNGLGNNYNAGDNIPLVLYLSPDTPSAKESATFYSDDYTTEATWVPTMYWEFVDNPPFISSLAVAPLHDLTTGDVDLYDLTTEDINAVNFTWNEADADDVWYRLLLTSDSPIVDKYHGATMWLPLNESITDYAVSPTYKVYNPTTQESTTLANSTAGVGDDVRGVLEGQGGFAPQLSTTEDGKITIPYATNAVIDELTDFTLVLHWTPSAADQGNVRYIATQADVYGTAADNFFLYKNADDKIVVGLGADIALTGAKTVTCDGEQPTNIILTLNTGSAHPNKANLYVDGAWQDGSTGTTTADGSNDFVLGGLYAVPTATGTTGMIEEVILYNNSPTVTSRANAQHVVNVDTNYVLSTDNFLDYDSVSTSLNKENFTYNARLMVADYHNFRGYNSGELGWSNQTSWGTTTI